ncbi:MULTISPECIES: DUF1799 domain-containing protein [unclassified Yoonia]|uniref:DUF1799 domain-containing protein n=1 Tax=unclassified Yoonia TaxID=2629118 RepID=UPI002AFE32D9|nr:MULTISPECIES: DUF1799 domain-containing protein [unclassified Yoonia]
MKAVGRAWATGKLGGSRKDDEAASDAKRWNIDLSEQDISPDLEIWATHLDALDAFLAVASQWQRVSTMSGLVITGLDYAGAEAGLRMAGLTMSPETWADVRLIEAGAVAAAMEVGR